MKKKIRLIKIWAKAFFFSDSAYLYCHQQFRLSLNYHLTLLHHILSTSNSIDHCGPHWHSLSQFLEHTATRSNSTPPPPGWDSCPRRLVASIVMFPQQIAHTLRQRYKGLSTTRVECLVQGHNAVTHANAWMQVAESVVQRTNLWATASLMDNCTFMFIFPVYRFTLLQYLSYSTTYKLRTWCRTILAWQNPKSYFSYFVFTSLRVTLKWATVYGYLCTVISFRFLHKKVNFFFNEINAFKSKTVLPHSSIGIWKTYSL